MPFLFIYVCAFGNGEDIDVRNPHDPHRSRPLPHTTYYILYRCRGSVVATYNMIFNRILRPSTTSVTKTIVERRVLQTHPLHLFRIIQDVDSYSSFLPLCWQSQVLHVYHGGRVFDATLTVGMPWNLSSRIQEHYTSRVTVCPETMTIQSQSIQSTLFDSLRSTWKLGTVPEREETQTPQCKVEFEMEMTVSDPLIASILDRVLEQVATSQIEAFDKRCQEIPWPPDLLLYHNHNQRQP